MTISEGDPGKWFEELLSAERVERMSRDLAASAGVSLDRAKEGLAQAAGEMLTKWEERIHPEMEKMVASGRADDPVDLLGAMLYTRAGKRVLDEGRKEQRQLRIARKLAENEPRIGGTVDREWREGDGDAGLAPSGHPTFRALLPDPQRAVVSAPPPEAPAGEHISYAMALKREAQGDSAAWLSQLTEGELAVVFLSEARGASDAEIAKSLSAWSGRCVEVVDVLAALWRVLHKVAFDVQASRGSLLPPELVDERRGHWRAWLADGDHPTLGSGGDGLVEYVASVLAGQSHLEAAEHVRAAGLGLPVRTDPEDRAKLHAALRQRFNRTRTAHAWLAERLDAELELSAEPGR